MCTAHFRDLGRKCVESLLQVIVGSNGSGKSTILKLTTRLYDPQEGQIFIGGHDIRTLKLYDLRQAISVLFQDVGVRAREEGEGRERRWIFRTERSAYLY